MAFVFFHLPRPTLRLLSPRHRPTRHRSGFYTIMFTVFFFYFFIAHGSKFIGRTKATKMFEGRKPWTRLLVVGTCWTCLLAGGKSFDWKLKISWWTAVVWLCRSELTNNVNFLYRFMRPPVSEVFRQSIDDP